MFDSEQSGMSEIEPPEDLDVTPDPSLVSGGVPPMVRADFRLPADLKARAMAEAERQGLDFSEYVRQCLVAQISWVTAIQAVAGREGMDNLASTDWLLTRLHDLAQD